MGGVAIVLLFSIATVIVSAKYLPQAFSFEQSVHYVFMFIGSVRLPWLTQRFFSSPTKNQQ